MVNARQQRGRDSQRIAADYLKGNGFPHAETVWGSQPGKDILGCVGLAPEVKATRGETTLLAALRQAEKNAQGDFPLVIWRPDGYGEAKVGEWVVALTFRDAVKLLRAAGYGTPEAA